MLLLCYMLSLVTPTGEALKISLYKYNDNKGFSILFYFYNAGLSENVKSVEKEIKPRISNTPARQDPYNL